MKVNITENAQKFLSKFVNENEALILIYDTEGCGCAVNGIPQLFISSIQYVLKYEKIKTDSIPIYMYKKQMIFFDEELTIDCLNNNKLKLYSNNQIFSNHMSVKKLEHPL